MLFSQALLFMILFCAPALVYASEDLEDPAGDIQVLYLSNGTKVILAPSATAKNVSIKVEIGAGFYSDPKGKLGTSHFLEHYLFTDAKIDRDLSYLDLIREKGGTGNAYTNKTQTGYHATVPSKLTPWIIQIFGKILLHKTFDPELVERTRGPVFLEIGRPHPGDHLSAMLSSTLEKLAHRPPGVWQEEFGVVYPSFSDTQMRIDTGNTNHLDLESFYKRFYHPENTTFFLAGNFESKNALAEIDSVFGSVAKTKGEKWKSPEVNAKNRKYFKSETTNNIPIIRLGTKVAGITLEEEVATSIYMNHLAHRLGKEFRNKSGETYTVRDQQSLFKGNGFFYLEFEAPEEQYYKNLQIVRDTIESEARKGEINEANFQEAKTLFEARYVLREKDSDTMLTIAEGLSELDEDYPSRPPGQSEFSAYQKIDFPKYKASLQKLFATNMTYEARTEPPLFFRFELVSLFFIAIGLNLWLAKKVFAKPFPHNQIRWVRKLRQPQPFIIPLGVFLISLTLGDIFMGIFRRAWWSSGLAETHFLIAEYSYSLLHIPGYVIAFQAVHSLFAQKLMVVENQLWIKSIGYWSKQIPLDQIEKIELQSPFRMLFSRTIFTFRFQYYDPCFWRPGLLIELKNGKKYFMSVSEPSEALSELKEYLPKTQEPEIQQLRHAS